MNCKNNENISKGKKRWKYLKRQCRARDRILCDHSSGFGFATSLPSLTLHLTCFKPATYPQRCKTICARQIEFFLSSTNANVESVGGGTPHPSCNLQMGSAGSWWGQIMEAKWGNRWKQWVEAQMMRGTKRWALQIGPSYPLPGRAICKLGLNAQLAKSRNWLPGSKLFSWYYIIKGSRKKCYFFTFSQDVRVSRSPLLLVRVL